MSVNCDLLLDSLMVVIFTQQLSTVLSNRRDERYSWLRIPYTALATLNVCGILFFAAYLWIDAR